MRGTLAAFGAVTLGWLVLPATSTVSPGQGSTRMEAPSVQPPAAQAAVPATRQPGPGNGQGLLPGHRIVSFYGNPRSARMGILGAIPPNEMLDRLHEQARAYQELEPAIPVLPALHLVAVVAHREPGAGGLYRGRMADSTIARVLSWTEADSLLLFLDIQPGRSSVDAEVEALAPFLRHPRVHLALDPEFAMGPDQVPGQVIGTMAASEVNAAIGILSALVREHDLPPKILVVHRFTRRMLPDPEGIRPVPGVQVVLNMDGFGPPPLKRDTWNAWVAPAPIPFKGFKLFYDQDAPLMSPSDVLALRPPPLVIIYQ